MSSNPIHRTEFASRRIGVNGITLNVVVEGQGPDVLLIHGFPDSHKVWRKQIPALVAAGFRVIAPDLRGFGDSDAPTASGSYKIPVVLADLAGILDAVGATKVRLVGHDWGAVIGWQFALACPQRVDRYVAMSVGHPEAYPRGGLAQLIKGYYVPILASPLGAAILKLGNWSLFKWMTNYPPELAQWKADMARPGRMHAANGLYRENIGIIIPRHHGRVQVPVMGMWSSGDHTLSRKQMQISGQYVDGAWRYEEVEGASHWLQLDRPQQVNDLLLEYLK